MLMCLHNEECIIRFHYFIKCYSHYDLSMMSSLNCRAEGNRPRDKRDAREERLEREGEGEREER